MKMILMNKNNPVGRMEAELKYINGFPSLDILKLEITDKKLCPVIFSNPEQFSKEEYKSLVNKWFKRRIIPECRQEEYKNIFKNDTYITKGNYHFFTLNDQYWVKYSTDESWEAYNFFTNPFYDENKKMSPQYVGDIFFSDNLNNIKNFNGNIESPDVSIPGNMMKRWMKTGNRIFLCKTGRVENIINEPVATVIIKQLMEMGFISRNFKYVNYKLEIHDHKLCSCCNNFITPNTELVTAYEIFTSYKENMTQSADRPYKHLINAIRAYDIPGGESFIIDMLTVDNFLNFFDRHLNNFGFLRNVNTGEFTGPAPLYDFGEIYVDPNKKNAEYDLFSEPRKKIKIELKEDQINEVARNIRDIDLFDQEFGDRVYSQIASKKITEHIKNKNRSNEDL